MTRDGRMYYTVGVCVGEDVGVNTRRSRLNICGREGRTDSPGWIPQDGFLSLNTALEDV